MHVKARILMPLMLRFSPSDTHRRILNGTSD